MVRADLPCTLAALLAMTVTPNPLPPLADEKPWAERAVRAHVSQSDLQGELASQVLEELRRQGEALFQARFTPADGAGRPMATQAVIPTKRARTATGGFSHGTGPDAASCAGCHHQPATGGAGDFSSNAFFTEDPAVDDIAVPDPDKANERATPHLFGAGLIELLAREMTADLAAIRASAVSRANADNKKIRVRLETKTVDFGVLVAAPDGSLDLSGVDGIDEDLVVRPFGHKGVFASLRNFTISTLNHHLGIEAEERFGFARTGELDFDGDGVSIEMTAGDVSALVAWQAGLKPPGLVVPEDEEWQAAAERGRLAFTEFGCSSCHRPALPLNSLAFADPGPIIEPDTLNARDVPQPATYDLSQLQWAASLPHDDAGRLLVPLFGDLKRHSMADGEVALLDNERLVQRGVPTDVFLTAELWGVASTAPYGHRNDFGTLDAIIRAHGGEARVARDAYARTSPQARSALIAFLRALRLEP